MEKVFKIILTISMLLAVLLVGCADTQAQEETEQQTKPSETVTVSETQAPTQAPTSSPSQVETTPPVQEETTQVIADPFSQINVSDVNIPLLETFGGAAYAGMEQLDSETVEVWYTGAGEEDYTYFVNLCSYLGLYRVEAETEDGSRSCYLLKPGYDYIGMVTYYPKERKIAFLTNTNAYGIEDDLMDAIEEYYLQDLGFPADFGMNVFVQFYISTATKPYFQTQVGELDYVFDGAMCWMEMYSDITYDKLEQYVSDMILCGYDVSFDYVEFDDNGAVSMCLLLLSNGDLEIIVQYDASDASASVYYEPGVMIYGLSGKEYAAYIPQR